MLYICLPKSIFQKRKFRYPPIDFGNITSFPVLAVFCRLNVIFWELSLMVLIWPIQRIDVPQRFLFPSVFLSIISFSMLGPSLLMIIPKNLRILCLHTTGSLISILIISRIEMIDLFSIQWVLNIRLSANISKEFMRHHLPLCVSIFQIHIA